MFKSSYPRGQAATALCLSLATVHTLAQTTAQRQAAVTQVLAMPTCHYVSSKLYFYWEVGDKGGPLFYRTDSSGQAHANRNQPMAIASASKWLYATYVMQKSQGTMPTGGDLARLNLDSSVTAVMPVSTAAGSNTIACNPAGTVKYCATVHTSGGSDGQQHSFSYGGAHFQSLAAEDPDLAGLWDSGLGTAISNGLGLPGAFSYTQPSLAGGVRTTPASYASFLQKMLIGMVDHDMTAGYQLGPKLGQSLVCASNSYPAEGIPQSPYTGGDCANSTPANPPAAGSGPAGSVTNSPFPLHEPAQYGMGHWLELPTSNAPAYSSPGSFGFYPSVDAAGRAYTIVSFDDEVTVSGENVAEPYIDAMYCGRNIRNAWLTGVAHDDYYDYATGTPYYLWHGQP